MNSAQRVIEKFGGQSALAYLINRGQTTVQYWASSGSIPVKWHPQLLALARNTGIKLSPEDFVEPIGDFLSPVEVEAEAGEVVEADVAKLLPVAQWQGELQISTPPMQVYVLDNGQRVISRSGAINIISQGKKSGNIESYLGVESLKPYLPENWPDQMVDFRLPGVVNKRVQGMTAETFLAICRGYAKALQKGALHTSRQREIAIGIGMFLAGCADVGLAALIDEATGYQYIRQEDALQLKLRVFLEEEMRKWEATFPQELWIEFGRLTHWQGQIHSRPKYWGKLVMELIYDNLDPDVSDWLREHNPNPKKGQNHHQWLSGQYGLRKLTERIWMVIGMAKSCESMPELRRKVAESQGRQPVQITMFLPPPNYPQTVKTPSNSKGKTSIGSKADQNTQLDLDLLETNRE